MPVAKKSTSCTSLGKLPYNVLGLNVQEQDHRLPLCALPSNVTSDYVLLSTGSELSLNLIHRTGCHRKQFLIRNKTVSGKSPTKK